MIGIERSLITIENSSFNTIDFISSGALFFLVFSELVINNIVVNEIDSLGLSIMELE